jgi:hypothetical protein
MNFFGGLSMRERLGLGGFLIPMLLLLLVVSLAPQFGQEVQAQSLQVMKVPGSPVTLSWPFDQADEPVITGFLIQKGPAVNGPWTDQQTVAANLRQVVFAAPTTPTFYQVLSYKDVTGSPRLLSLASNVVAVGITLPPPFGVAAQ